MYMSFKEKGIEYAKLAVQEDEAGNFDKVKPTAWGHFEFIELNRPSSLHNKHWHNHVPLL